MSRAVAGVEPDVRAAAEAMGAAVAAELRRLRPALSRPPDHEGEVEAVLEALDLDREGGVDGVALAACLGAHRAYVTARGRPEAVSLGALPLARLLVWASRAAMLGPAPKIAWIGPEARRPEPGPGQFALVSRCRADVSGERREARAAALVSP